ncbi:TPA: hypothetical protein HA265_00735 [Candidatus Woesearchaeota archaeon]|nr:hypothetical protein [Candidatus Woesearchaeota archaeon]
MKTPRKSDILARIERDFMEEFEPDIDMDNTRPGLMKDWEADVLRRTKRPN